MYIYIYIHIDMSIYIYMYIYKYMYIYIYMLNVSLLHSFKCSCFRLFTSEIVHVLCFSHMLKGSRRATHITITDTLERNPTTSFSMPTAHAVERVEAHNDGRTYATI